LEAWLLRHVVFPLGVRALPPGRALRTFREEGEAILHLVADLPPERLTAPVLIKRLRGLEDSSRYWSVAMTLEHLIIVGTAIRESVPRLAAGQTLDLTVSTADVKPSPGAGPQMASRFRKFCAGFADPLRDLCYPAEPTLAHPWFGDLSPAAWVSLAAIHQRVHRKQIEAILTGLTEG
jgi:hypothetical protein